MSKKILKASTLLYPVPVLMISCGDFSKNEQNILVVSWSGTLNTDPPMVYISVRPSRHSYSIIKKTKEFVINLPTKSLTSATDYCGLHSGKNLNKFEELNLTKEKAHSLNCPIIKESPINIECKLKDIIKLGTHHMFISEIVSIMVDEKCLNEQGKIEFSSIEHICYSHREYFALGEHLGGFGFTMKK